MNRRDHSAMIGARTAASPMRTSVGMAPVDHRVVPSPCDRPLWHAAPPPGATRYAPCSSQSGDVEPGGEPPVDGFGVPREHGADLFGRGVGHGGVAVVIRTRRGRVTAPFVNPSWMPHSVGEAARAGDATADDLRLGPCVVPPARRAAPGVRRRARRRRAPECGRHGGGLPASARAARHRAGPGPAGGVRLGARREALGRRQRSTSGAWTAPTASTPARRCGAARPTASGGTAARRATSGCSRWPAWPPRPTCSSTSSTSGPDGEVDLILSADPHEGNWLPIAENATTLVVRHFFYDWDTEVASSLSIERIGATAREGGAPGGGPAGGRGPPADRPG